MNLDLDVCSRVGEVYQDCFSRDVSREERFDDDTPRRYAAPFETYKEEYGALSNLGLTIVDPSEVGYTRGRGGVCYDLAMHLLGLGDIPLGAFLGLLRSHPITQEPREGDLVLYVKSLGGYSCVDHYAIHQEEGVVSKFGTGPIFRHPLHHIPFFDEHRVATHTIRFLRTK